jgi:hypothetical protein
VKTESAVILPPRIENILDGHCLSGSFVDHLSTSIRNGVEHIDLVADDMLYAFVDKSVDFSIINILSSIRLASDFFGIPINWVVEELAYALCGFQKYEGRDESELVKEILSVKDTDIVNHIKQMEKVLVKPKTLTFSDTVRLHEVKVQNIIAYIKDQKKVDIADGKITSEQINALGETLSRVDDKKFESYKGRIANEIVDHIYLWAIANARIVFPYLTLESAAQNIKSVTQQVEDTRKWGLLPDGKIHLPKIESNTSNFWYLLSSIIEDFYGPDMVVRDGEIDETYQEMSNTELAKEPMAGKILFRIMELIRSPGSATFRSPEVPTAESTIKNQVDLDLIDGVRLREYSLYKNYTLNPKVIANLRRTVTTSKTEMQGKKSQVYLVTTHEGSKLAETISSYGNYVFKKPESNPLYKIISKILSDISLSLPKKWTIPKNVFLAPSIQVRSNFRQGPKVKTKGGKEKANAYIPFSFVKSASCASYPASVKKELTDMGAAIVQNADLINSLDLQTAGDVIPLFSAYIRTTYVISDQIRRNWSTRAKVPSDVPLLKELMVTNFQMILKEKDKDLTPLLSDYNKKLVKLSNEIVFMNSLSDPKEMEALIASIAKVDQEKKDARKKRQTSA